MILAGVTYTDKKNGWIFMKKKRGKGFKVSIGRWAYENKKVNNQMLRLKKSVDEMNATLQNVGKRK